MGDQESGEKLEVGFDFGNDVCTVRESGEGFCELGVTKTTQNLEKNEISICKL